MSAHKRRGSLAWRLLAGGTVIVFVLVGFVGAYLLVNRANEDQLSAASNAQQRVHLARDLLSDIVAPDARFSATQLASLASIQNALTGTDPAQGLADVFETGVQTPQGMYFSVFSASGAPLYSNAPSNFKLSGKLQSVRIALANGGNAACIEPNAPVACRPDTKGQIDGVEMVGHIPSFDVAMPVYSGSPKIFCGIVVASAPLVEDFHRYGALVGEPVVFIDANSQTAYRFPDVPNQAEETSITPPSGAPAGAHSFQDTSDLTARYSVDGVGQVVADYIELPAPDTRTTSGYLGAEFSMAALSAQTRSDELHIAGIAFTAMVAVTFIILAFVVRFVRKPIARLERGVARIAAGDYSTDVRVDSNDELGRLADAVNIMRRQIKTYVDDLDLSISQLRSVSRALTTTTAGEAALHSAIVRAAQVIAGDNSVAWIFQRRNLLLLPPETDINPGLEPPAIGDVTAARVMNGEQVHEVIGTTHHTIIPMFFQDQVMGALSLQTPAPLSDSDARALEALANNGGVALENTRMFEQEKATVQRLRELDTMKTDFLSNAQHELRTPVLAIMGQLELITLAWSQWNDEQKLDIIKDIDASTHNLSDLLETIIDFSLLSAEHISLKTKPVQVAGAIAEAVSSVRKHYKDDLPLDLHVDVPKELCVEAEGKRFRQVVHNVLENSVKFTPRDGHVKISARQDGNKIRIDIEDDGIGIGPDAIPKVFDRFYQEDNSKTRKYGGLGMGLALVKRLCEAHGAQVLLTSVKDQGTRVTILWPAAPPQEAAPVKHDSFHLVAS